MLSTCSATPVSVAARPSRRARISRLTPSGWTHAADARNANADPQASLLQIRPEIRSQQLSLAESDTGLRSW